MIRLGRGDIAGAEEDRAFHSRPRGDASRIRKGCCQAWRTAAVHHQILGDKVGAHALADEALELARAHIDMAATANHLIFVAGQMGLRDEFLEIVEQAPEGPWKDLIVVGAKGDLRSAGDLFAKFGGPSFEALARLFAERS